jgi:4'-phosphopantetheinyl transferase
MNSSSAWTPAAAPPALRENEVHVWRARIDAVSEADIALLSQDELQRADQFLLPHLRHNFIARHAFLRRLIAAYLDQPDPKRIAFSNGANGKPELAGSQSRLKFNLSDSGDYFLLGVSNLSQLGVDIEKIRTVSNMDDLAETCFSSTELTPYYAAESDEDRLAAFFSGWTRKEAFIKALGLGLAFPLKDVEVTMAPLEARIVRVDGASPSADRWTLVSLEPAPGYAAAVAADSRPVSIKLLAMTPQPQPEE